MGEQVSWATEAELAAAARWYVYVYNINILVSRTVSLTIRLEESGFPNPRMRLLLDNNHFSLILSTKHTGTSQNSLLTEPLQPIWDWFELPAGSENQQSGPSLVNSAERLNKHH